jgi:hypothetical protein
VRHEIVDMSLAKVIRLSGGHDSRRLWIVYGECGSHEVYLTDDPTERDPWETNPRLADEDGA